MKFSSSVDKSHLAVQAGMILLASTAVGVAYNVLNPAGLRWQEPRHTATEAEPAVQTKAPADIYQVETISVRLISSTESMAAPANSAPKRMAPRPPAAGSQTSATAVRTTWEKVQPLVEHGEVVLVDSRPLLTYEAGHIPTAVSLPYKRVVSEIGKFAATYPPPEARLVVYCAHAKCASSSKLAALLTRNYGYREVQYVPGGYLEWLQTQEADPKKTP
ncbi:MAG: rhodanese-related sulfurtransferase [Verrucomicrobiales bacterium]|jgi:rhodanese-related sulfurtransferase